MAWNDLASNECPTKADINARFKEYLNWQSRSITFDNSDYTVNPGGAHWNYLFIWIENTISEWNNRTPYIPIPSCLLIPKADNGAVMTFDIKIYDVEFTLKKLELKNTLKVSFNGTTGDIRLQKENANITCYFNYIVFC